MPVNAVSASDPAGSWVVYFHGVPGAPSECAPFQAAAREHGISLICQDRGALHTQLFGPAYFQALADDILARTAGRPVHLIGFSIGAFVALQTGLCLGQKARGLHLVSAAAPLDAGDFLPHMAGRPVFELARRLPGALRWLSRAQAGLARRWPDALFRLLFASAQGADRALATQADFRSRTQDMLQACLLRRRAGYLRDLEAYVQPWRATLRRVAVPTELWHGAADNWSPVAMVRAFQDGLGVSSTTHIEPGLSHYSCLEAALPRIFAAVAQSNGPTA